MKTGPLNLKPKVMALAVRDLLKRWDASLEDVRKVIDDLTIMWAGKSPTRTATRFNEKVNFSR